MACRARPCLFARPTLPCGLPLGLLVLLVALTGCRQGAAAAQAPAPQPAAPAAGATSLSPGDPRMLRFHKVDMLVAQWDVAQASARVDQADALAAQIRSEVDAAFPDFVTASRGAMGMRLQYVAVSALGFSGRREATSILLDRFADMDPQLVGNALIALKVRADPETPLAPLLKMATANAVAPRRYAPLTIAKVVEARWRTGRNLDPAMQKTATHVLSGLIADRDAFVRLHVANALGAIRGPGCFDLLMIMIRDEEIRIRLAAAAGLERIGDPNGFPEVIRLLQDVPEDIQPTVRDILVSYAERIRGGQPLDAAQVAALGSSAYAWNRWFGEYAASRGLRLEEGHAPGQPPGAFGTPAPASPASPSAPPPSGRMVSAHRTVRAVGRLALPARGTGHRARRDLDVPAAGRAARARAFRADVDAARRHLVVLRRGPAAASAAPDPVGRGRARGPPREAPGRYRRAARIAERVS